MNIPSSSISRPLPAPSKDWTLLYVLDGDNDLREAATLDLVELDREGAPENVNVAAQLYRGELRWGWNTFARKLSDLGKPQPKSAVAQDWRGMKVYETRHRDCEGSLTREVAYSPSIESAPNSPASLEEFLVWGMTNYPAKHFAVIMAGHGTQKGILPDGHGRMMAMEEAGEAIRRAGERIGQKPDLLVLDACATASEKTAQAFSGVADYLVASPEKIRGGGWSESKTLSVLAQDSDIAPRDFAQSFLSVDHTAIPSAHLYNLGDGSLEAIR